MKQYSSSSVVGCMHEFLLSLNIAFTLVAVAIQYSTSLRSMLHHVEFVLNGLSHSRQTDYFQGYWEFFVPAIVLALCAFVLLRLFSRSRVVGSILGLPA